MGAARPASATGHHRPARGPVLRVPQESLEVLLREGRRIQQMWTTKEFPKDFTLRLEFRATPNADSGVFLRKPQLQCRDYLLAGPYKELKKYKPQDWNEVVVVVKGATIRCTCNGEELAQKLKLPDSGPIGLEADRGVMEYRKIRVKALK